jgi:hypothetical protein
LALGATAAQASVYTVEATTPVSSWLDTGIIANPGTTYTFTVVDPATIWSAGSNDPSPRTSTADGIDPAVYYGQYTMDGFTANYGALVGETASGFFLIGTGPTVEKGLSGDVKVGYWDSYYGDNSGSQTLSVTGVPEMSTWAMMALGLAALGFAGYTGSRKGVTYTP